MSAGGTVQIDVTIVGGGHNALVAAAYLARAGLRTIVLERLDRVGGAAVSAPAFPGVPARLSRYSYLVSLLPEQVVRDLGLRLELRSRTTASYTPVIRGGHAGGLMVESMEGPITRSSFAELTGSDEEYAAWRDFYSEVAALAAVIAPTLTGPLPRRRHIRGLVPDRIWHDVVEHPLGETIVERFSDDDIRGVVGTDALIGTFASLHDQSLIQNRCFLYHLIGNGTGEWRVPVGGMGAVTAALEGAARSAGADVRTGHEVVSVGTDGQDCLVTARAGDDEVAFASSWVLSGVAPPVLSQLRDITPDDEPRGAQLKINLLVEGLPNLRSGADPREAFAGTFHVGEGFEALEQAYAQAASGDIPSIPPGELYCHSLTDSSILGPRLARQGFHTLTYFGLHMPPEVFEGDIDERRDLAAERVLNSINQHLEQPLESMLATDENGDPCFEVKTPQDIESALNMPGGHIFHGDLAWPWLGDREGDDTPAQRWGVATDDPRIMVCGSGSKRGGAVSGLGGHSAAHAVLEARG